MRILGIDPGLAECGYGVVEGTDGGVRLVEAGVIKTPSRTTLEVRLERIYEDTCQVLDEFAPDVTAIEQLYSHYDHPRTAILMGHARGAILLAAAQRKCPVVHYSAKRIKMFLTGTGAASKQQMQRMICQLLHLKRPPKPSHVADALAVALCHGNAMTAGQRTSSTRSQPS